MIEVEPASPPGQNVIVLELLNRYAGFILMQNTPLSLPAPFSSGNNKPRNGRHFRIRHLPHIVARHDTLRGQMDDVTYEGRVAKSIRVGDVRTRLHDTYTIRTVHWHPRIHTFQART